MSQNYSDWLERERWSKSVPIRVRTDRTASWNIYSCLLVLDVILEEQGSRVHPRRIHQSFVRHARAIGRHC